MQFAPLLMILACSVLVTVHSTPYDENKGPFPVPFVFSPTAGGPINDGQQQRFFNYDYMMNYHQPQLRQFLRPASQGEPASKIECLIGLVAGPPGPPGPAGPPGAPGPSGPTGSTGPAKPPAVCNEIEVSTVSAIEGTNAVLACPADTTMSNLTAKYVSTDPARVCGTDVSSVVNAACKGKTTCTVAATNPNLGGDPCPGIVKSLSVSYQCRPITAVNKPAKVLTASALDFGSTTLTCAAEETGKKINIVSATYLAKDPARMCGLSVTAPVSTACQDKTPSCPFTSNPGNLGGVDPCPGIVKELKIYYTCV